MRTQKLCSGYRHWMPEEDITMCAPADWMVWEVGIWKQTSFGSGGAVKVERMRRSYFAMGIRVWGRHILGNSLIHLGEARVIADGQQY